MGAVKGGPRPAAWVGLLAGIASLWLSSEGALGGDYQLGDGLDLGPVNIAGYSNVVGQLPQHHRQSLQLDDLSLFVTGHFDRLLNPFVEAELSHFTLFHSGGNRADRGDGDFVLERLYNDSYLTDSMTLRLGKMLSPVGEWNELHAAPLVLTTVRPAVTYRNFSEYTTGLSLRYADPYSHLPDLQLYYQPTGEFSERPRALTVHRYRMVGGAHLSLPLSLLDKVGLSFQQSKDATGVNQSLYGLDFHYTLGKLTLQGEGAFSDIGNNGTVRGRDTEWGAYTKSP